MERATRLPVAGVDQRPDICVIEVSNKHTSLYLLWGGGVYVAATVVCCEAASMLGFSLPPYVPSSSSPAQLGGTIGDIEGMPFNEAFRQFQFRVGVQNFCNIHVSLVPQVSV